MVIESLLFNALLAVTLLWATGNAVTMHARGSWVCTLSFGVGKSMEPAIPRGLTAYIEHYPTTIEEGDIVTFRMDGMNICHRVVEIDGEMVRFKGDNNRFDDGWHHRDVIMGKLWRNAYIPLSPAAVRGTIENWRAE